MIPRDIIEQLESERIFFRAHEPLAPYTYWKIGGPCDLLVEPANTLQLQHTLRLAQSNGVPYVVIGDGTNILVKDEGFRGIVIRVGRRMSYIEPVNWQSTVANSRVFRVGAGTWVPYVAHTLGRAGYTGLEHTIGIPGTFGGLVFMNGGSLRQGIGSAIDSVTVVDPAGRGEAEVCPQVAYSSDECSFGYRASRFQQSGEIITEAIIRLNPGSRSDIVSKMHCILSDRRRKFPRKEPSCGSVFVSDPKLYEAFGAPAKVIEDLGLKGTKRGGAMISERHANFIVNTGNATAADVLSLANLIEQKVLEHTGVHLGREFRVLGE
ncbi:UDP-N-acetylmuramate dehydrogenase [Alkalispirochaeta alkalica]|uniref:UDP-N-acetylmuramate dehydrogenase n=1 Tax=Alkalispirochaeta alkalica TaxID=46356 RepID=UPI0003751C67|nr:UDP-N-acetylmuramate dehydrogenase [Alkalispirochaeta alkalica]